MASSNSEMVQTSLTLRGRMSSMRMAMQTGIAALAISVVLSLLPLMLPQAEDKWHWVVSTLSIYALLVMTTAVVVASHAQGLRDRLVEGSIVERSKTQELFVMTDMLQSADTHDDAYAILRATSQRLLPDFAAALYTFNNSRDRLDLVGHWGFPDGVSMPEMLAPNSCWALKRGKFHINDVPTRTLCCNHHVAALSTIEIPMLARGSVYGLLIFGIDQLEAFDKLRDLQRLGRMLADSMSLSLSNIALREQLRTQSLRDPLTGLYNRRYMEDSLERYTSLAERSGASTSVIMIDLDHFKSLNDLHGHAKGDAVLRDVAAQLVGGVRPTDVVCRYGGEELMIILPECGLDDAAARAEVLRCRVEALGAAHEAQISASFGVATIPETSTTHVDVVAMADAALYVAKQQGRNRVLCADRRAGHEDRAPRLAVSR